MAYHLSAKETKMHHAADHPDSIKVASAQEIDAIPLQYKKFQFMVPVTEYRSVIVQAKTVAEAETKAKKLALKRHNHVQMDSCMRIEIVHAAKNAKDLRGYSYSNVFNNPRYWGGNAPVNEPRRNDQIIDNIQITQPIITNMIKDIP